TLTTAVSVTAQPRSAYFSPSYPPYDPTILAPLTGWPLVRLVFPENGSCVFSAATAHFANKTVGDGKTVTGGGFTLTGAAAGNYSIGTVNTSTANITPRDLTVTATGVNKQYDGNSTATVTLSTNELAGDAISASYANASFANKNVGTGKAVSVSGIAISGADAGNYNLTNTTASTTANITARTLVVTATGANKVYDGTTDATVTLSDNRVSGDVFSYSYTSATFANKNVGNGKTI